MVSKTPTPVLVDTAILSRIVSDLLAQLDIPASRKSACLNTLAARIAGRDKNWGFLTGREAPVIANGLAGFEVVRDAAGAAELAPADPRPTESDAIPVEDMTRTLRKTIEDGSPFVIASAPPGLGLSEIASEIAEILGRRRRDCRVGLLRDEEEIERDLRGRPGLREDLRPLAEPGAVTIYQETDGFSDAGLAALEAELRDLAIRDPKAQVILATSFPDELTRRLRQAAP